VRLWLPAADAVSPGAIAEVEAPPPALRAADVRLIYVEDDPLVNATTAELLEREGFAIHAAADAAHALRLMDTHPDARALLIDVGLPGMNGFELATVARRSRPDLKVLFLSGHDRCNVKAPPPEDSDTRYVVKPYRQQDLFTALRRLLATH
jgi:CheY-like chemotaxis protein